MKGFNWKSRCGSRRAAAALALSVCLCLGLTAAPPYASHSDGSTAYAEEGAETADGFAMGRYVEQTLEVPEIWIHDVAALPDGRIRLIGQAEPDGQQGDDAPYEIWDSADGGASWEKAAVLPEEMSEKYFISLGLAPDGGGAGAVYKMTEDGQDAVIEYYNFDAEGNVTQIPVAEDAEKMQRLCFGSQGELIGQDYGNTAYRVNRETGEIEQTFTGPGDYTEIIGVCGQELLMVGDSEVQRYDIAAGEPLPYDESLNEQLFEDGMNYAITTTSSDPIAFGYTDDGRMYYTSTKGIFAHVQGGTVVEQIVDGGMCSLSSPGIGFLGMAVSGEEIYVACLEDMEPKLLKYVYSADTPTVPDKEVRVYSLEENAEVRQAIVMYQNAHPDTRVNYEIGLSGEGGMTASDALRTLNTDIMAGNGPDVLVLDGMPVDSYIEKGVLADISEIRTTAQGDAGFFEPMTSAWEEDGIVYAMPIRFKMPLIAGDPELVGQAKDLTQLADLIVSVTDSTGSSVVSAIPSLLSDTFLYYVCAGAWRNEDSTIDQEKLLDYMVQVKKIRDSQAPFIDSQILEAYGQFITTSGSAERISMLGVDFSELLRNSKLEYGAASSVRDINNISSVNRQKGNITFAPLSGQQSGVFVPSGLLGISSMAADPESARSFVEFMFTDEAQTQSMEGGFPVSRSALWALLHEKEPGEPADESYTWADNSTGEMISMESYWMTQEEMDQLTEYVESLNTAADTDTVLLDAVLAQADKCLEGECSPEDAVNAVMQTMNLYLAEG